MQNIHNEMELPGRMVRFRFFFCKSKLSIRLNEGQCQSEKLKIMYMIFIRIVQKSRPEMPSDLPGKKGLFKLLLSKFPHITKVCQVNQLCFTDFTGWAHRAYGVISCFASYRKFSHIMPA